MQIWLANNHKPNPTRNMANNNLSDYNQLSKQVPEEIQEILQSPECVLAISISGGKDSQAMLKWLSYLQKQFEWKARLVAIHADLGRIEWPQTSSFVKAICDDTDIELIIVRREKGDMIDRWKERYQQLKEQGNTKPFWSSAAARYCTSELKIAPINKYLRQHKLVINAMGLRSQESKSRSKKSIFSLRESISGAKFKDLALCDAWRLWQQEQDSKPRLAIDWNPILNWDAEQVWDWCGTSAKEYYKRRNLPDDEALKGWPAHPAYVLGTGNERLSCAFCVLASQNDLKNAIPYNQEIYNLLVEMEAESGWFFQQKRSLKSLAEKQNWEQLKLF